jgi:[ribosomal protein S5]-alanine N-acetyltransferase
MGRRRRLELPLRSTRLELRLPTTDDAPTYLRIQKSKLVAQMRGLGRPLTLPEVRAALAKRRREARQGSGFDLAVELRSNGEVIGRVALKGVLPKVRQAEVAYWFDPNYWGQGFATEAVYALCRAGFQQLGLHRIEAGVFEFNQRSVTLLKRIGFRREGRFRKAGWFRRRWVDDLRFGLLRSDLHQPTGLRGPREGLVRAKSPPDE